MKYTDSVFIPLEIAKGMREVTQTTQFILDGLIHLKHLSRKIGTRHDIKESGPSDHGPDHDHQHDRCAYY